MLLRGFQKTLSLISLLLFHAVTLMASSSVVCGASCGAACVVLGFPRDVVATQLAPSSPVPAPGPPGDRPGDRLVFKLTVVPPFFEDVLNEITTFAPLRGLSREAKCDQCASLRAVRVLLHMQTAMGRHMGAKVVILGVPRGSMEGPSLSVLAP